MTIDSVDDMHAAEDLIVVLTDALEQLLADVTKRAQASAAAVQGEDWCRPTCGWRDNGECEAGDTCGCPCDHGGVTTIDIGGDSGNA